MAIHLSILAKVFLFSTTFEAFLTASVISIPAEFITARVARNLPMLILSASPADIGLLSIILVITALPPLILYHARLMRRIARRTSTTPTIILETRILVFISSIVVPVPPSSSRKISSNIGRIFPTKTKSITAIIPRSTVG